jgi:hypothetical protein
VPLAKNPQKPATSRPSIEGSGVLAIGPVVPGAIVALTLSGLVTVNTVGTPLRLPSISKVRSESALVGSLVWISEVAPSEASRKSANSSGEESTPGAICVVESVNATDVPYVNPVR